MSRFVASMPLSRLIIFLMAGIVARMVAQCRWSGFYRAFLSWTLICGSIPFAIGYFVLLSGFFPSCGRNSLCAITSHSN